MDNKEKVLDISKTAHHLVGITNKMERIENTIDLLCEDVGENSVNINFNLWAASGAGPDATMGQVSMTEVITVRHANKEFFKGILKAEKNSLEKDFETAYSKLKKEFNTEEGK